jgi:hypothetical protein
MAHVITSEDEFKAVWPGHASAVLAHVRTHEPLRARPWAFMRALLAASSLATVGFESSNADGDPVELWISVMPDGTDGWSILSIYEGPRRRAF